MRTSRPPSPDFPKLLRTLRSRGVTYSSIARELNTSVSTVTRWGLGDSRPSFHLGADLVQLLHRHASPTSSRELFPLTVLLASCITCDLQAPDVVVCSLEAIEAPAAAGRGKRTR